MTIGRVMLYNEQTGEEVDLLNARVGWSAPCPRCSQPAAATNQVIVEQDGHFGTGFADTPDQVEALRASIAELNTLQKDASLEEVATLLEQTPQLRPVAKYLREHALEIGELGIGVVALVIALLAWLMPLSEEAPPAPPDGITYDQMQDMIEELREETPPAYEPAGGRDRQGERGETDTFGTDRPSSDAGKQTRE